MHPIPFRSALSLLVWTALALCAAAQTRVQSALQPGVLKLGQPGTWTITVEADGEAELLPPEPVDGLRFGPPSAPSLLQSLVQSGRQRTLRIETSWRIPVVAERAGEFTLPAPRVRLNGQEARGEPRSFEALADLAGAELGLFRIEGAPARLVEGQPVVLQLIFGWRAAAGRSFNHAALFLPWWRALPGAFLELAEVDASRDRVDILVNRNQRVTVERLSDYRHAGELYLAFRLPLLLTPTRPGTLELSGSFLEFGEVVQERTFFGNSTGRLTQALYAPAEALAIEVRPLPREGQPLDFGGAIGSFTIEASASPRELKVGDTLKLVVEIRGQGNLPFFAVPEPDIEGAFRGFQYFGFEEDKRLDRRRIEFDLVPMDTRLGEVPPFSLPVFDPQSWSYTRVSSAALPIAVRPLATAAPLAGAAETPRFADDLVDIAPRALLPSGGAAHAPDLGLLASVAGGLAVGWLALRSAVRLGGREPGGARERQRRRALSDLQRALATSLDAEGDLAAWASFLARRSGETPAAWIGRDLERWSAEREAGGAPPLSRASLESLRRIARGLESASYGRGAKRLSRADLLATARELLEDGL